MAGQKARKKPLSPIVYYNQVQSTMTRDGSTSEPDHRPQWFTRGLSRVTLVAAMLGAMAFLATACRTASPTGVRVTAYITVPTKPLPEIRLALIEAFQKRYFDVRSAFDRELVFQKRAGLTSDVMFGGWSDPKIWHRARVTIKDYNRDTILIECVVCRVSNQGDSIMEEEQTTLPARGGPYKKILDEAKTILETKAPATAKP